MYKPPTIRIVVLKQSQGNPRSAAGSGAAGAASSPRETPPEKRARARVRAVRV
jgi:hypothetical protein